MIVNERKEDTHVCQVDRLGICGHESYCNKNKIKRMKSLQKTVMAGVPKPLMPELDIIGSGMESLGRLKVEGIEVAITVTSEHLHLGVQVLDGETKRIEFNRDKIVVG
jgi:hypothetical protein